DPRAQDADVSRAAARDAGRDHAAAAVGRLQAPRADLDREPARDLAHRREQRQRAVGELDGLVADGAHAALEQCAGQRLVRRQVEIGEDDQARAEVAELRRQRLLHLHDHLGVRPAVATRAPAVAYASSSMLLPRPALRSITTSWPCAASAATPLGVKPTRCSSAVISRGTPIRTSRLYVPAPAFGRFDRLRGTSLY